MIPDVQQTAAENFWIRSGSKTNGLGENDWRVGRRNRRQRHGSEAGVLLVDLARMPKKRKDNSKILDYSLLGKCRLLGI